MELINGVEDNVEETNEDPKVIEYIETNKLINTLNRNCGFLG